MSVACGWIWQDTDDRAHSKWSNSPGNVVEGAGDEDRQLFMMGNEEASSCVMSVEQTLLEEMVMDSLSKSLCPREMQVLKLRYGLSGQRATSPADMGELLGISRERVRQIEKGALKKVMADDTHNLREFLWML
jgi:RNA polymerase sigma factor (sigma-70 family)